jgi:hypothetical protein
MSPENPDTQRLVTLERQVRRLQRTVLAFGAIGAAAVIVAFRTPPDEIVRTRQLVIEDESGRPRVILGAPIADLEGRKRSDPSVGMLVLDEDGVDRLSLGSPSIAPQIAGKVVRRIAASSGVVVNDAKGNERTGYGYLENGSVVLGLDHEDGEGVMLFINPSTGYSGFLVNGRGGQGDRQRVFLGAKLGEEATGPGTLVLNRPDASWHTFITAKEPGELPLVELYDGKGGTRRVTGEPADDK